jgi:hypothetical protein
VAVPEDIAEVDEEAAENDDLGLGQGMQVDDDHLAKPVSRDHTHHDHHDRKFGSSSEFGAKITNTAMGGATSGSSPRLCKRMFADVEDAETRDQAGGNRLKDMRTPKKKAKLATDLSESDGMNSEDEVEVAVWNGQALPSALRGRKAA